MSLIGIDMGSSSVKAAAYDENGKFLGAAKREISPIHPAPGLWEQDPEQVWRAASNVLFELAHMDCLRRDPPRALAVSASGRENFPADEKGRPLYNNIMGGDVRGAEFEVVPPGIEQPEEWELSCGHMRERMDPVFRLRWWRTHHPAIIEQASQYPDWHGFLTLRLCGRNVSEPSLTARWLIYDMQTNSWSEERLAQQNIPAGFLPEVFPGGTPICPILRSVARDLGLQEDLLIVTGGHDLNCAALGAGVNKLGMACLISGSYENMLIPTLGYPSPSLLRHGFSFTPHFGEMRRSIYAICPTGNAVLNWARETAHLPIGEMETLLAGRLTPSDIVALPYLSGAMLHYPDGRKLRGALLGLTLATKPVDILQAFMESIAYDHVSTITQLRSEGVTIEKLRATGGGTRSRWWTQLKADMIGLPVEVAGEKEPGAFGAALLAGIGAGVFSSVEETARVSSGAAMVFEPDVTRRALHEERFAQYGGMVLAALRDFYTSDGGKRNG
ncbi:MAG: FGGY-family carbohydrate kinase [Bacillota bacterium]